MLGASPELINKKYEYTPMKKSVWKSNCNKPHPHPKFSWLPWITIASPQIFLPWAWISSQIPHPIMSLYPLIQLLAPPQNLSQRALEKPIMVMKTCLSLDEKPQLHSILCMKNHKFFFSFLDKKTSIAFFLWCEWVFSKQALLSLWVSYSFVV